MKTTMSVNSKSIMVTPELRIDYQVIRKSVLVLRAVNHKLRQDMIRLIDQEGKMTVTDLYVKLRLEQSVTSQHLALLQPSWCCSIHHAMESIFITLLIMTE
jgi:predicted transcriptional regulator